MSVSPDSATAVRAAADAAGESGRETLLSVRGLRVSVADGSEVVHGVDLDIPRGSAVGLVGESGSGKTLTCRAVLGLLPVGVEVTGGEISLRGTELTALPAAKRARLRGTDLAAVFQDPASYLNPSITVGAQLAEVLRVKIGLARRAARYRAVELLHAMGLRRPTHVYSQYPFELSGGMLQRVLIAMSITAEPELLIADEATTALDVTVQAEVLELLTELRRDRGLTLMIVSHDLAVISQMCDTVHVFRDGSIVEAGPTRRVLRVPRHPYTRELIENHERFGIDRVRKQRSQQ
ncbi:ABC transporter ATP-binding protein [Sphaerisporangium perillae]|uniref:ABC transporter ATP-binding protein n=1 Tax=Sphaerisporangium perillae TaxID=2935860 RepID=UPI00200C0B33|nr:ABC transporter ATP-binding protein [Sphaerisporangium perillae]